MSIATLHCSGYHGDTWTDYRFCGLEIEHDAHVVEILANSEPKQPGFHRDDAMNRRCNNCELLLRECKCKFIVLAKIGPFKSIDETLKYVSEKIVDADFSFEIYGRVEGE